MARLSSSTKRTKKKNRSSGLSNPIASSPRPSERGNTEDRPSSPPPKDLSLVRATKQDIEHVTINPKRFLSYPYTILVLMKAKKMNDSESRQLSPQELRYLQETLQRSLYELTMPSDPHVSSKREFLLSRDLNERKGIVLKIVKEETLVGLIAAVVIDKEDLNGQEYQHQKLMHRKKDPPKEAHLDFGSRMDRNIPDPYCIDEFAVADLERLDGIFKANHERFTRLVTSPSFGPLISEASIFIL